MIKNHDQLVKIKHNPNLPYISDHSYRTLIVGRSGSGKTILLLNLIKHKRRDVDKIYLYIKDPLKSKYQLLIKGSEKVGNNNLKSSKAFIHVYENLEDYILTKKRKVLVASDHMIADMKSNKKKSPVVTGFFLRGRNLSVSLVFIPQSYFKVLKTIRLNATHYFIMKIPSN